MAAGVLSLLAACQPPLATGAAGSVTYTITLAGVPELLSQYEVRVQAITAGEDPDLLTDLDLGPWTAGQTKVVRAAVDSAAVYLGVYLLDPEGNPVYFTSFNLPSAWSQDLEARWWYSWEVYQNEGQLSLGVPSSAQEEGNLGATFTTTFDGSPFHLVHWTVSQGSTYLVQLRSSTWVPGIAQVGWSDAAFQGGSLDNALEVGDTTVTAEGSDLYLLVRPADYGAASCSADVTVSLKTSGGGSDGTTPSNAPVGQPKLGLVSTVLPVGAGDHLVFFGSGDLNLTVWNNEAGTFSTTAVSTSGDPVSTLGDGPGGPLVAAGLSVYRFQEATQKVKKLWNFPKTVHGLVAVDEDHFLALDDSGSWGTARYIDLGQQTELSSVSWVDATPNPVWMPSTNSFYLYSSGSPSDIDRLPLDPATGILGSPVDSPYHGDYDLGSRFWPLGDRILTSSGLLFRLDGGPVGYNTSGIKYQTSLGTRAEGGLIDLGDRYLLFRVSGTSDPWYGKSDCQLVTIEKTSPFDQIDVVANWSKERPVSISRDSRGRLLALTQTLSGHSWGANYVAVHRLAAEDLVKTSAGAARALRQGSPVPGVPAALQAARAWVP